MNDIPLVVRILSSVGLVKIQTKKKTPKNQGGLPPINLPVGEQRQRKIKFTVAPLFVLFTISFITIASLVSPHTEQVSEPEESHIIREKTTKLDSEELMKRYPFPSSMQNAIDSGELDYSQIPDEFHRFVKPRLP